MLIVYNRDKNGYLLSVYDMEWNNISDKVLNKDNPHFSNKSIPKPHSFDKMVEAAASLSKRYPQVRVDFYDVGGNAIFGEMTFSTGYGYFTKEFYDDLGEKVDLSKVNK